MHGKIALRLGWLILLAGWLAGCVYPMLAPPRRWPSMVEETLIPSDRLWTRDRVLMVNMDGILTDGPAGGSAFARPSTLVHLMDNLKQCEKDASIKAIIFRVNSPGGTVTASDLIYQEILQFKERTGKKVVFWFMDLGASGAYYAAMAADRILACPTAITGSIGVVAVFPGLHDLSGKLGLSMRVIKSGEYKDLGSLWRIFGDKEKAILQQTVDSMHARFVEVVDRGRTNLNLDQVRALADGRIYTAQQAKDRGLIDEIGYMRDAFKAAKDIAGLRDARLCAYRPPMSYKGHYYADWAGSEPQAGGNPNKLELNIFPLGANSAISQETTPFYYLWVR